MTGVTLPSRVQGADGKSYPSRWLSAGDRDHLAGRVHYLSHKDGLSVRQIIAQIEADYGIRRSVGWVSTVLRTWKCTHCSAVPNETPEQGCSGGKFLAPEQSGVGR